MRSCLYPWICCIILLVIPLIAVAQTVTTVNGRVTDAGTGHPLAFISVAFPGSGHGVNTDDKGNFNLSAPNNYNQVIFSFIGYQPVTKTIHPGEINTINVSLENSKTQLKEVVVSSPKKSRYKNKDNPAVELIQRVIDHKDSNRMQSADYLQYDQYERVNFSLFHLSPKFLSSRFFNKYRFMLDTSQVIDGEKQIVLPVIFSEKNYKYYYRREPAKSIQLLQAEKEVNIFKFLDTAGMDIYLNRLYGNNVDLYANNIFIINNQFLSPIADHAPNYYKFFITDTVQSGSEKLVALSFTPRTKGDHLFEGKLLVTLDGSYAVKSCELNVNKDININFMRSLSVWQDFEKYPDGRYYLLKSRVKADFSILKNKGTGILGERSVFYKHYLLHQPQPSAFYDNKSPSAPILKKTDTTYWKKNRADTLPAEQEQVYAKINRLENMPSFKRTTWIASTITRSYADLGPFQAGPLDAIYSFNNIEGTRVRFGGRTTPEFNPSFYLEGYGAYGSLDEQFKYYLSASYAFNKLPYYNFPNNYFKLSYQYDTDIPGQNFLIQKSQSVLLSISRGTSNLWLYNRIFRADYVRDLENHFSFDIGLKNWNQQPAGALSFQDQLNNNFIHNLTTTEFDVGLRYAPHEQIMQGSVYRRSIHSKYPIFSLQINHGFNKVLNGSYNYTNISGNIYKRVYLSQLGYSDVTLQGGILAGQVPFPLLNILPANQTYLYDREAFNMMNFLEFVSDHYVGLDITHSFNGFILNKIPLVEHLKLKEYLSFKIIYGGLRSENDPLASKNLYKLPVSSGGVSGTYALGNAPYIEAGIGIGNIFKLIRIDAIHRFNYLDHPFVSPYGIRFSFVPDF
ncbi:MAG: hypothetical protein JWR50_3926 [Mucilaginibacter sp.]|nr:hypothetical protein [Mucilaginibacter sp.]